MQDAAAHRRTPGVTFNAVAGAPFTTTIGSFTDADPTATANYYGVIVDWGDGTTSSLPRVRARWSPTARQFDVVAGHTYAVLGHVTPITTTSSTSAPTARSSTASPGDDHRRRPSSAVGADRDAPRPTRHGDRGPAVQRPGRRRSPRRNRSADGRRLPDPDDRLGRRHPADRRHDHRPGHTASSPSPASHTYAEEGVVHRSRSRSRPSARPSTTTATTSATVADAPITVDRRSPQIGDRRARRSRGTVATFIDGNPQAPLVRLHRDHQLGRRHPTVPGVVTQPGGVGTPFVVTGTHTYPNGADFPITVTVNDVGGSTDTQSTTAVVTEGRFSVTGP